MTRRTVAIFFNIVLTFAASFAQSKTPTKEEVMRAIRSGANYACNVLLSKEGESKCDYNMMDGKWYPYEPAWHTGQIINALVDVYNLTGEGNYLNAAKKAGDWWLSLVIVGNPKLQGMLKAVPGEDTTVQEIQFSTISDGTPGLFNLYSATHDKRYAELPTSAGEWMLQHMYLPKEGLFYDRINAETGEVLKTSGVRKGKKGQAALALRSKLDEVARPNNEGYLFKDIYEFTKDRKYKGVFLHLCESLVQKQGSEGLWMQFRPNNAAKGIVHPRFNLWYAESLIKGYQLTGNNKYLDAAKKTIYWYIKHQAKDGSIPYRIPLHGYGEDSFAGSAVSFLGLLEIRLYQLGAVPQLKENIERCAEWVIANRFSPDLPDKNLAGAFIDLNTRSKDGKAWITQRDIGTSFALRFLTAYYKFKFE
jgi:uncharacterized protein YyaL (SSP411 family)